LVFSELKKLFTEKEYRLFLVLVLWLLIGFSIFQFKDFIPIWLGYVIFLPLLVICAILFILSLIFRNGIDLDEKIHKVEGAGRGVLKWIMFLGGTIISIIIMVILLVIGRFWARTTGEVQFSFDGMTTVMMVIMIFLLVIGIIFLFRGKLNAWLGVFFLFVSVYFLYLMISAYFIITSSGDTTYNFGLRLALYLFDVLLIIYTTTTLIGKKTEVLSEKLKFIKPDGILMWLIFSKAAYEFAKAGLENINIGVFNAIAGLLVFVVLFFVAGLYGIVSYGKREEEPRETEDIIES